MLFLVVVSMVHMRTRISSIYMHAATATPWGSAPLTPTCAAGRSWRMGHTAAMARRKGGIGIMATLVSTRAGRGPTTIMGIK